MNKSKIILPLCLAVLTLTACSEQYAPPSVNERRVQVSEEKISEQYNISALNDDTIAALTQHYAKSGTGPVDITVTFDPESHTNTAMHASDEALRISRVMRKNDVQEITTGVLPVRGQGNEAVAVISYSSYQASAPANCGEMPGLNSPTVEHDPNYHMGCTVEAQFAKQIANPADLLGNARPPSTSDGRISANVIEAYRVGAPNKPLEGETASDSK